MAISGIAYVIVIGLIIWLLFSLGNLIMTRLGHEEIGFMDLFSQEDGK